MGEAAKNEDGTVDIILPAGEKFESFAVSEDDYRCNWYVITDAGNGIHCIYMVKPEGLLKKMSVSEQ